MQEHILLTGGTGFIGQALSPKLLRAGATVSVLTRQELRSDHDRLHYLSQLPVADAQSPWPFTCVINLAGENLFAKRWTSKQKAVLRNSRLGLTRRLVDAINVSPKTRRFISASAIGYYGPRDDSALGESSSAGDDFAARLCRDWEAVARSAQSTTNVQILRFGVVLGNGGALANLLPPFKLGLGGKIGDGRQWFSWIHIDDLCDLICACVNGNIVAETINATAPQPVRNKDFAHALGRALKRPAIIPMPAIAMRVLLGEAANLLTTGQRVLPEAAQSSGFEFRYPDIDGALHNIVRG